MSMNIQWHQMLLLLLRTNATAVASTAAAMNEQTTDQQWKRERDYYVHNHKTHARIKRFACASVCVWWTNDANNTFLLYRRRFGTYSDFLNIYYYYIFHYNYDCYLTKMEKKDSNERKREKIRNLLFGRTISSSVEGVRASKRAPIWCRRNEFQFTMSL